MFSCVHAATSCKRKQIKFILNGCMKLIMQSTNPSCICMKLVISFIYPTLLACRVQVYVQVQEKILRYRVYKYSPTGRQCIRTWLGGIKLRRFER